MTRTETIQTLSQILRNADDELFMRYYAGCCPTGGLRDGNGNLRDFTDAERDMRTLVMAERQRRGI